MVARPATLAPTRAEPRRAGGCRNVRPSTGGLELRSAAVCGDDGTTIGTLLPIIRANINRETAVMTDAATWYKNLKKETGFPSHETVRHEAGEYVRGHVIHTNTVEGFFGHFKTDLRGTHHSVSRRWLGSYLNEWVWKWNHRDDDEAMFRQLLVSAASPRTCHS